MQSHDISRKNMIDGQIKPNKVTDAALIDVISRTPRERFVPRHLQNLAYIDEDIALGNGRYLPEPMVIARLIQEAAVMPTDLVLDIGCGSGYSTALLAQLSATVVGLESSKDLADEAERHLRELDILNAAVVHSAELGAGYASQGPYQVIIINGAVADIPQSLLAQMADGGRLVAVVRANGQRIGQGVIVTRHGSAYGTRALFDAATPPLPGFGATPKFSFE